MSYGQNLIDPSYDRCSNCHNFRVDHPTVRIADCDDPEDVETFVLCVDDGDTSRDNQFTTEGR